MSQLAARIFYAVTSRRYSGDDQGLLAKVRRAYFEGDAPRHGKESVHTFGADDTVRYRIGRRGMRWELSSGGRVLERTVPEDGGYALLRWDTSGDLREKSSFTRANEWLRTSYYCGNPQRPMLVLEPQGEALVRLSFDVQPGKYSRDTLVPVPVEEEPMRTLLNNETGAPDLLAQTDVGAFYYCTHQQAARRAEAKERLSENGALADAPDWVPVSGDGTVHFEFVRNDHALDDATSPVPDLELESEDGPLDLEWAQEQPAPAPLPAEEIVETAPPDEPAVIEWDAPVPSGVRPFPAFVPQEQPAPEPPPAQPIEVHTAGAQEAASPEETGAPQEELSPAPDAASPKPAANPESDKPKPAPYELPPRDTAPPVRPEPVSPVSMLDIDPLEGKRPSKCIHTSSGRYDYFGPLRQGMRQGQGRTQMENGHTAYEGGFSADKRDGFGTYYYKSGKLCYAGYWRQNQRDGFGVSFSARDGSIFAGQWQQNRPTGRGAAFDANGMLVYYGMWLDGQRDGQGTEYCGDGVLYAGQWRQGVYCGKGCLHLPDGGTLTGIFRDGSANGPCEERDADGNTVRTGVWKDGAFVSGVRYEDGKPCEIVTRDLSGTAGA